MNRGEMRDRLRRELRDVAAVEWPTDAELDDILNTAYFLVQKEIIKVKSEAHLTWDHITTQAGVYWYPLPATFGVKRVGLKAAASDTAYAKLEPKAYEDVESGYTGDAVYVVMGEWIGIFPAPATAITNGIEILHSGIMSIGAGPANDTEVPKVKTPLHQAIVWWAKLLALGETDEEVEKTRNRLNEVLGDLGQWYGITNDTPDMFRVG